MQANRLINVARRMQASSSITDLAKRKINKANNEDTINAYLKEAAELMRPSRGIEDKKEKEQERKDGGEQLMQEILTVDIKSPIHAAKALRIAEKHKAIANRWRSQAHAEDRRRAREENADAKTGQTKLPSESSAKPPTHLCMS